jgi:hypothetical protein
MRSAGDRDRVGPGGIVGVGVGAANGASRGAGDGTRAWAGSACGTLSRSGASPNATPADARGPGAHRLWPGAERRRTVTIARATGLSAIGRTSFPLLPGRWSDPLDKGRSGHLLGGPAPPVQAGRLTRPRQTLHCGPSMPARAQRRRPRKWSAGTATRGASATLRSERGNGPMPSPSCRPADHVCDWSGNPRGDGTCGAPRPGLGSAASEMRHDQTGDRIWAGNRYAGRRLRVGATASPPAAASSEARAVPTASA